MSDSTWQNHAREALQAMVEHRQLNAVVAVKAIIESGDPDAIPQTMLLWIDSLLAVTSPPKPALVPDTIPGIGERQLWALKMIATRVNDDPDSADQLLAEAASGDFDQFLEYLSVLLTAIAQKLRGPSALGAQHN